MAPLHDLGRFGLPATLRELDQRRIIGFMIRRSTSATGLTLLVLVASACVTAPTQPGASSAAASSPTAEPTGTFPSPGISATSVPSPASAATSTAAPSGLHDAIDAARRLLDAQAFDVDMDLRREKRPDDPIETLIVAEGRVEPSIGRGHLRVDFSGLIAIPESSEPPDPNSTAEVIWTPEEMFARSATLPGDPWEARTRAEGRSGGGYVGRLPDEVLGLARLVASSRPQEVKALEDAPIDGENARRWLIRMPVEATAVEGVPADVPSAAQLRDTDGVEAIEVEVWLVDGSVRRIRYVIAREKAAYGGPDRTTVTYDWSQAASDESIVVPPPQ